MKTRLASLLVVLLIATTQLMAQQRISVQAQDDDISYNLDLQAVSSIFGESRNLEEFEMKLNDYDNQISNLDLNQDGEVDYLRVIETSENNVHVVVIQAVLDQDVFQDVATVVVERDQNRRTYVQVIGDPYLYGDDYIIEPIYVRTPSIFSFFWGRSYHSWASPYYWGYYPNYYRDRRPYETNIYLSNVGSHINRQHSYRYSDSRRNNYSVRLHNSISRNDYGRRNPSSSFSHRNTNVRNKQEFHTPRTNSSRNGNARSTYQRSDSRRNVGQPQNGSRNTNVNRNTQTRTSTQTRTGTSVRQNNQRGTYQARPTNNSNRVERSSTNVTRENNRGNNQSVNRSSRPTENRSVQPSRSNENRAVSQPSRSNESRSAQPTRSNETRSVSQPSRQRESRSVEQRSNQSTRSNDSKKDNKDEGRSSNRR